MLLKYEIIGEDLSDFVNWEYNREEQRKRLIKAPVDSVSRLINEIAATHKALQTTFQPKDRYDTTWEDLIYAFELRWQDLVRCAELDGYRIPEDEYGHTGNAFVPIEPEIEGHEPLEDDLTSTLRASGLQGSDEIIGMIGAIGDHFRSEEYNACLNAARVALQTLATAIADHRKASHPGNYAPRKWGQVIAYLRTSGLITEDQEAGLTGVFSFVSDGSHVPVNVDEEEYARLGRHLVLAMAYFLVKVFQGD